MDPPLILKPQFKGKVLGFGSKTHLEAFIWDPICPGSLGRKTPFPQANEWWESNILRLVLNCFAAYNSTWKGRLNKWGCPKMVVPLNHPCSYIFEFDTINFFGVRLLKPPNCRWNGQPSLMQVFFNSFSQEFEAKVGYGYHSKVGLWHFETGAGQRHNHYAWSLASYWMGLEPRTMNFNLMLRPNASIRFWKDKSTLNVNGDEPTGHGLKPSPATKARLLKVDTTGPQGASRWAWSFRHTMWVVHLFEFPNASTWWFTSFWTGRFAVCAARKRVIAWVCNMSVSG